MRHIVARLVSGGGGTGEAGLVRGKIDFSKKCSGSGGLKAKSHKHRGSRMARSGREEDS